MNDNNKERSHEWLLESGMFTTTNSKSFLELTILPKDLLRLCVEHLASNPNRSNRHDGKSLISPVQLNQIYQRERCPSRVALLNFIRQEILQERERMRVKKLVDWIGPIIDYEGMGICLDKHSGMLINRDGGCSQMECFCGSHFCWSDAKLNLKGVLKTYHELGLVSELASEITFRRRLLKVAERIVISAIASSQRKRSCKKNRPILKQENRNDIIRNVRYHRPSSSPRFEEEDKYVDPMCCDGIPRESASLRIDESSSTHTPTDISFCDYIVVSGRDEIHSTENQDEHLDDCSYSVLSGCETIHSLDDLSNAAEETTMLSYCKVVKLGISIAKRAAREPFLERTATSMAMSSATASLDSSNSKIVVKNLPKRPLEKIPNRLSLRHDEYGNNLYNEKRGGHDDDDDDDDDDDVFLSIYDGAKSSHGGRSSSRFRGNSRTQRSSSGWGNQRRPNWSRKRRKEYKRLKSKRIRIQIRGASTVPIGVDDIDVDVNLCPQCGRCLRCN